MKKTIFTLAIAAMIISCKEKTEKTERTEEITTEQPAPEMMPDTTTTMTPQNESTVDTTTNGTMNKTEKTTKVVK